MKSKFLFNIRISVDPEVFWHTSNLTTIILHEVNECPAISPNNNAFLIYITNPFVSFYYVMATLDQNEQASNFKIFR